MKRKRIILATSGGVLILTLFALFAPGGDGDVSKVRIGFADYGSVDGKRSLILIVTNGSSCRISQPDGSCELRGESPEGGTMRLSGMHAIVCGSGTPEWGWWQLKPPNIPSIAPGKTFRFTIPVDEGAYTWSVKVPFITIPLRDRLPFALRSLWPRSENDTAISFEVSPPPIPPPPSRALGAIGSAPGPGR